MQPSRTSAATHSFYTHAAIYRESQHFCFKFKKVIVASTCRMCIIARTFSVCIISVMFSSNASALMGCCHKSKVSDIGSPFRKSAIVHIGLVLIGLLILLTLTLSVTPIRRGTAVAAPPLFRPGEPGALCGSRLLFTPY